MRMMKKERDERDEREGRKGLKEELTQARALAKGGKEKDPN